jgi:integrase
MLTIRAEVRREEQRKDGTFRVKIRFTQNRKIKRLPTKLFAKKSDLNKSFELKEGTAIKKEADYLIFYYEKICSQIPMDIEQCSIEDIMAYVEADKKKYQIIDFIAFSESWMQASKNTSTKNYKSAVNALKLYINREELNIKDITNKFLTGFMEFLEERWRAKAEKLKKAGKIVPTNRATSLYLGSIRHLFNEAKKQYNDYDRNIIIITNDPFKTFTVPKQCTVTRKRALTPELIKKIWELPYQSIEGYKMENRFNLAKDCFILSFCLMGMNSADLYNAEEREGNTIIYYRTKTRNRRADNALMKVNIPKMLMPLIEKYKDKTGKRIFNFYQNYVDIASLNRSINIGLKEIGAKLKIDALQYYAARHSWATIAVNRVGIDKYTVHSALNHVDDVMKVTDIYIERDFVNENKANRKVVRYVFGKL